MTIENGYDLIDALKDEGRVHLDGSVLSGTFEVSGVMEPGTTAELLDIPSEDAREHITSADTRTCRLRRIEEDDEWFTFINPADGSNGFVGLMKVGDVKDRTCGTLPEAFTEV